MCWSAEGSLQTYAFGMILAAIHKYYGSIDPALWVFMVAFTHIQLVEYFLWKNLGNPSANRFWSGIGFCLISILPLIAAGLLPSNSRDKLRIFYLIMIMIYLATRKINLSTEVGGNGHLKWNWIDSFTSIWTLGWPLMVLIPLFISGHRVTFIIATLTYIMSSYFNDKYGTAASYWCWVPALGWLLPFNFFSS